MNVIDAALRMVWPPALRWPLQERSFIRHSSLCVCPLSTTHDPISWAFSLPVSDGGRNEATVKPHAANLSYAWYKIAYRRTGFDCVVYRHCVPYLLCLLLPYMCTVSDERLEPERDCVKSHVATFVLGMLLECVMQDRL